MKYQVNAPVKDYTGEVAGVALVKGSYTGELSLEALAYFQGAKYDVREADEAAPAVDPAPAVDVDELRARLEAAEAERDEQRARADKALAELEQANATPKPTPAKATKATATKATETE